MRKLAGLIGFAFLPVILLAPNTAVASPGAISSGASALSEVLANLVDLVTGLLTPSGDEVDGRGCADPWGCPSSDESELGHGMEPWG